MSNDIFPHHHPINVDSPRRSLPQLCCLPLPGQPGFSRAAPTDDQRRQARPRDERNVSELPLGKWVEHGLMFMVDVMSEIC